MIIRRGTTGYTQQPPRTRRRRERETRRRRRGHAAQRSRLGRRRRRGLGGRLGRRRGCGLGSGVGRGGVRALRTLGQHGAVVGRAYVKGDLGFGADEGAAGVVGGGAGGDGLRGTG